MKKNRESGVFVPTDIAKEIYRMLIGYELYHLRKAKNNLHELREVSAISKSLKDAWTRLVLDEMANVRRAQSASFYLIERVLSWRSVRCARVRTSHVLTY